MKQLPGKKNEKFLRVQMDQEELHKLLDPILKEVNSLRARVTELETARGLVEEFMAVTAACGEESKTVLTVLVRDHLARMDDGK